MCVFPPEPIFGRVHKTMPSKAPFILLTLLSFCAVVEAQSPAERNKDKLKAPIKKFVASTDSFCIEMTDGSKVSAFCLVSKAARLTVKESERLGQDRWVDRL